MDPAGVLGTVTVEDQRSYIKIETLRGKNPTEIHRALSEVCGELTVDRSTVSRWVHRFRLGRMSRTATDERSVKLVTDALEKDRRATCEELSEATGISPTSTNKNGVLVGIIKLPRRWDSVIQKQGDYIEGQ
ncbi:hypothetical protein C0J52_16690 [Blattella germanica]|nr:hypothetical protein C0J52_16690 [Blattella germanica]